MSMTLERIALIRANRRDHLAWASSPISGHDLDELCDIAEAKLRGDGEKPASVKKAVALAKTITTTADAPEAMARDEIVGILYANTYRRGYWPDYKETKLLCNTALAYHDKVKECEQAQQMIKHFQGVAEDEAVKITRLRASLSEAMEVLEFYSIHLHLCQVNPEFISQDRGNRARTFLNKHKDGEG